MFDPAETFRFRAEKMRVLAEMKVDHGHVMRSIALQCADDWERMAAALEHMSDANLDVVRAKFGAAPGGRAIAG